MNISFIVQARMGSSRLPEKVMLPFHDNQCILELLVNKLKKFADSQIIIATADTPENDVIEKFCKTHAISCYRGSENDVLERFIRAAETYDAERIIRICSDNPFIELESIGRLIETARYTQADYMSFMINGIPSIKTHFGFWTEYVTLNALKRIRQTTNESIYHEHVTNYIYTHPDKFTIEWIEGPECLKGRYDIRLTCDTPRDFQNTKEIYRILCARNPYPTIKEITDFLDLHDEYLDTMIQQIRANTK